MSLQKCKKDWDEKLYKFALKRFGKVSNIGFYKMFLTNKDFIHDNYLAFITDERAFNTAESLQHYFNKFVNRIITYQKLSYSKNSKTGHEYLRRWSEFQNEPNWGFIEEEYFSHTVDYEEKLHDYTGGYKILSMYANGQTYVEISKNMGTYPVKVRKMALKEIDHFKKSKIYKEFADARK